MCGRHISAYESVRAINLQKRRGEERRGEERRGEERTAGVIADQAS